MLWLMALITSPIVCMALETVIVEVWPAESVILKLPWATPLPPL